MKFNLSLFSLFLMFTFISSSNAGTGPASEYKITMSKLELCETGSTTANCLNPLTISPSNTSGQVDIASAGAGQSAGSYGNIAKAKIGTKYTYMQITMSRAFQVTGEAGNNCKTKAGETGSKTADAAGQTGGTAGSSTLYVPDGSSYNDHMNGSVDALGASVSNDGVIGSSDEYLQYRKIITGGLTVEANKFPTVKITFDVSAAVGNGGATCTNAVMYADEPEFTITFQ